MNPQLPLADIHLPGEVSAWPPAYGWWILAALLLLLLYAAIKAVVNYRNARVQKKMALAELAQIQYNAPDALQQINAVLKRSAMAYYSREQVAGLSGQSWKQFLTAQLKNPTEAPFDDNWLLHAYAPTTDQQMVVNFHRFAQNWLKQA